MYMCIYIYIYIYIYIHMYTYAYISCLPRGGHVALHTPPVTEWPASLRAPKPRSRASPASKRGQDKRFFCRSAAM